METTLSFQLAHIGIHQSSSQEAQAVGEKLCDLFGFSLKVGSSSFFAGEGIEIMKSRYLGAKGHIAIGTNNINEAICLLERKGVSFLKDTAKYDADNRLKAIYIAGEIGGFAVHLLQQ